MSSETSLLTIRSHPDVRITVYDQAGTQRVTGQASVAADLPRGRYQVHLDLCDFVTKHEIKHRTRREYNLPAPAVESPAPIEIARDSAHHASVARELSVTGGRGVLALGDGERAARLFVFVRRLRRVAPGAVLPSEPISIHDWVGRHLVTLSRENADHSDDPSTGYMALSCQVPPGTYRLRVGRGRRDLAITIPAGRAAQVFLADRGTVSLRTARIYLLQIGEAFDAASKTARAMESVLWALGRPRGDLPEIARDLLRDGVPDLAAEIERDPVFGIACAHLVRRHGRERALFDSLMEALHRHAPELPDVVILQWTRGDPRPSPLQPDLALPPLFRASITLALAERVPAAVPGVFAQVAVARHDDSVWCTWSPRWWDERWVEATVAQLRRRADMPVSGAADIASVLRIPEPVVVRALERLDAAWPDGTAVTDMPSGIPGCSLHSVLGTGDRSTVFLAHREDTDTDVAVKILPVARADADRIAGEIPALRVEHPRLVRFERSGKLPDGSMVWLEMERCRESLFDQLAKRGSPLALDEACDLVLHVLEGLEALHAAGIVHGRVHPKNLLVRTDGSVALALPGYVAGGSGSDAGERDPDGDAVRFTAPEVLRNPAAATMASDVWSIAATLYFLITLELPRERLTGQSELDAAHNPVIGLTERLADVPAELAACLDRALSSQTDRLRTDARYGTVKEFREALAQVRPQLVALRATRLYDDLVSRDPAFVHTIRNLFLRLTRFVGDAVVGQMVRDHELDYADAAENRRVREIVERFSNTGLITRGREEFVIGVGSSRTSLETGLAAGTHRAAAESSEGFKPVPGILGWGRLKTWNMQLGSIPEARGTLLALCDVARLWHPDSERVTLTARIRRLYRRYRQLWRGERVRLADRIRRDCWFGYNKLEQAFLRASRIRLLAKQAMTVAVLMVLGMYVVHDRDIAMTSRAELDTTRTQLQGMREVLAPSLQDTGRQLVLDGHPFQALPYLMAARRAGSTEPALQMLFHVASQNLLLEHRDVVVRAAFSPDGRRVVTASRDGTAAIWDAGTAHRIAVLEHRSPVMGAAFSPDGRELVTGSEDGTAQVWNTATGTRVGQALHHDSFVESAMFSPDGMRIVTASLDRTARIWDVQTGALVQTLAHRGAVWSAVFSPDGTRIVTASRDRAAQIWDVQTGALVRTLAHRQVVWGAAWSPDGTRVATASQDATAQIWDAATGKAVTPPLRHGDGVTSVVFDTSGKLVATTSHDRTARVWDVITGQPVTPPLAHGGSVTSAMFSADGARLLTASRDGMARIWDARTGHAVTPALEHTAPVLGAAFSGDGTRVVTASEDHTARVWNVARDRSAVLLASAGGMHDAAFSPDGLRVVTASSDNVARIWDTTRGAPVGPALVHEAAVRTVAFSPDGKRVVTTSDRTASVWDAATGQRLASLAHAERVTSAAFSSDGQRLVTTSGEGDIRSHDTLQIWDISGRRIPWSGPPDGFTGAALSSDRTHLITVNRDHIARIWSATTGNPITPPLAQPGVVSVAFSPDERRVVTASEKDQTARIWDVDTGRLVAPPLEHYRPVKRAAFAPDGGRIVTVSVDGAARVWDATTGKPLTGPLVQDTPIVEAAFSADGALLFTVDSHTVRAWDVALDRRPIAEWSDVADRSPYVVKDGVLMLRSIATSADSTARRVRLKPSS